MRTNEWVLSIKDYFKRVSKLNKNVWVVPKCGFLIKIFPMKVIVFSTTVFVFNSLREIKVIHIRWFLHQSIKMRTWGREGGKTSPVGILLCSSKMASTIPLRLSKIYNLSISQAFFCIFCAVSDFGFWVSRYWVLAQGSWKFFLSSFIANLCKIINSKLQLDIIYVGKKSAILDIIFRDFFSFRHSFLLLQV